MSNNGTMAVFSTSRSTVDLAIDPLITCKLCLGECTLQDMYELHDCKCIYCTSVSKVPCIIISLGEMAFNYWLFYKD